MSEKSTQRDRSHPRHRHRAAAHESAHAEGANHTHAAIPEHPLIPRGQAQVIVDPDALTELLQHIRGIGSFAYDSEFIGEMSYFPKLCLVQVATRERVVLIDPLAGLDLLEFWQLVCDPSVEKIVHAGQQDIEPVIRLINKCPANIFDTQIAAGFMALSYPPALSKLLKQLLHVHIGKGFTFTHWDHRPLSAVQLRYAADDVRYLPALRALMGDELNKVNHLAWAQEESNSLANPALYEFDREADYLKLRGAGSLSPHNLAVLRELMAWRDQSSRIDDLPPRSFLRDEILIDMARKPIRSVEDLKKFRGLPKPVESAHAAKLLEITQHAMSLPSDQLPHVKQNEESPADRFRIDAVWATAQAWCMGRGIDPALVTNRNEIREFYRGFHANADQANHRLMKGWRREALGEPLLQCLRGKNILQVSWNAKQMKSDSKEA